MISIDKLAGGCSSRNLTLVAKRGLGLALLQSWVFASLAPPLQTAAWHICLQRILLMSDWTRYFVSLRFEWDRIGSRKTALQPDTALTSIGGYDLLLHIPVQLLIVYSWTVQIKTINSYQKSKNKQFVVAVCLRNAFGGTCT
jgi:hypothetical protein